MSVKLKAITAVIHNGRIIKPGEIFSCQSDYAKKLVANKSASFFYSNNSGNNENGSTDTEIEQIFAESGEENNEIGETNNEPTVEELTAIFDEMGREELIELANKNNISLKARTPKPDIIAELIKAGVAPNEKNI